MDALLRKNQELSAILEVSRVLTKSFNLEENLISAMETLASHLEMQRGCVFLLDPISGELKIVAAHGLTQEEIRRGKYRTGEGIVGRVIENGVPMFVPNIGEEPKFLNRTESRPEKGGISFLCIPITLDGKTLGVISVDRIYSAERGNVDDDLRVLRIVSSFIAQFVKLWEHFIKTENECGSLRSQLKQHYSLPNLIGESQEFQRALKSVTKVASTDTTVLLLGESGTGKELIARTLHCLSRRVNEPFVAVNLAALPENLIEAELFGVEKGAYTGATTTRTGRFENADKGTLFLDEIGELPFAIQIKLLRVLQEKSFERVGSSRSISVDVRVITATNRNLLEEVENGTFRGDLYWRLNVVPIQLPPLRERKTDIPILAEYYLNIFNKIHDRQVILSEKVIAMLLDYSWPGNVRELANTVERLVIMAESDPISVDDLPSHLMPRKTECLLTGTYQKVMAPKLSEEVENLEKERIIDALRANSCVVSRASRALGITARQLGYRLHKYGIDLRKI